MKFIFWTFLIGANLFGAAGNDSSGGVESYSVGDVHAWFVGKDKIIRACVEVDAQYPLGRQSLEKMIADTFAMWNEYTVYKNVLRFYEPRLRFAEKLTFSAKCDGTEDLTVYFGKRDDRVAKVAAKYTGPYAMAELEKYDPVATWGKGFIWIDNFRTRYVHSHAGPSAVLEAVLTHEVGHVFGCEHKSGTVMSPQLIADLWMMRNAGGIDMFNDSAQMSWGKELVPCQGSCPSVYKVMSPGISAFNVNLSYELVTGKVASAHVDLEFHRKAGGEGRYEGELVYRIGGKEERYPLVSVLELSRQLEHAPLFSIRYKEAHDSILHTRSSFQASTASYYAVVKRPSGKDLPVFVNLNAYFPLDIQSLAPEHVGNRMNSIIHAYRAD